MAWSMNTKSTVPRPKPCSSSSLAIVAPPSPSVPTTTVTRSPTPACSRIRPAIAALSGLNSTL
ncbi:MAG TPA: hypothetical protein VF529_16800 [Solirubrobacteraceae bacterium]